VQHGEFCTILCGILWAPAAARGIAPLARKKKLPINFPPAPRHPIAKSPPPRGRRRNSGPGRVLLHPFDPSLLHPTYRCRRRHSRGAATVGAPPKAPNPSGGADTGNNFATAQALFISLRPTLRTSATTAQVAGKARPPAKRKVSVPKRPSPVAGANHPPSKKGKVPATRRVQQPPPPAPSSNHPVPPPPSTDPSSAHMVFDEMSNR
jgi:hypothetical protein